MLLNFRWSYQEFISNWSALADDFRISNFRGRARARKAAFMHLIIGVMGDVTPVIKRVVVSDDY
jgi:hypothetical protein